MRKLACLVLLITGLFAVAQDINHAERMMKTMGIDKILHAQRAAQQADIDKQVAMVMKQLEGVLSDLPKETSTEIETAMRTMMSTVVDSWDVDTAVRVYAEEWNKNYTPADIDKVIARYEDPSAKKELEVLLAASAALNRYISGNYNAALEKAMADLMPSVQQAIKKGKQEIQARKQNPSAAKTAHN